MNKTDFIKIRIDKLQKRDPVSNEKIIKKLKRQLRKENSNV